VAIEVPYRPIPLDQSEVRYAQGPDSVLQPGVPVGRTVEFEWRASAVYPGSPARSGFTYPHSTTRRSQRP